MTGSLQRDAFTERHDSEDFGFNAEKAPLICAAGVLSCVIWPLCRKSGWRGRQYNLPQSDYFRVTGSGGGARRVLGGRTFAVVGMNGPPKLNPSGLLLLDMNCP